jgi:hypothetical protein
MSSSGDNVTKNLVEEMGESKKIQAEENSIGLYSHSNRLRKNRGRKNSSKIRLSENVLGSKKNNNSKSMGNKRT